jgi:Fe-S-cluster containining protein
VIRRDSPSPLATALVDDIWIGAARALGYEVTRSGHCYASSDGGGHILIGLPEILDVDDCVAQLVFHELCHALVEGQDRRALPDWGLPLTDGDVRREHACLRVQAQLADECGLRELMSPTTEYRAYYQALPKDLVRRDESDPASDIAAKTLTAEAISGASWISTLRQALAATAANVSGAGSAQRHPLGFALGAAGETCGTCAWLYVGGRGRPVERCRQASENEGDATAAARTSRAFAACEKWEPPVDCETCGACCREAYHVVSVSMRDPVVWRQPDMIVRRGYRFEMLRTDDRCAALEVDRSRSCARSQAPPADHSRTPAPETRYRCGIYQDRPTTCRDFAAGGHHCLHARRRVGLSR